MELNETYLEQVKQRLKAQEALINAVSALLEKIEVESRGEYQKEIQKLENKQEIMRNLLKNLKVSDENTWKKIQKLDTAMVEFRNIVSHLETKLLSRSK